MPIYTVLGGTGSTGSAVIRCLIDDQPQDLLLRIFVRSSDKLMKLLPILESLPNIEIIEGKLDDSDALSQCFQNTTAVFSCIATNSSEPGTSIAVDSAAAVINGLNRAHDGIRKSHGTWAKPLVVMLSSASLGEEMSGHPPAPIIFFVKKALYYIYQDLRKAEALYRQTRAVSPDLLDVIFVRAPVIMPGDIPTGHELSTEYGGGMVSFADLGNGMIEMVSRREELKWKGVSVRSTESITQDWSNNVKVLVPGLLAYFLPWIWSIGRRLALW